MVRTAKEANLNVKGYRLMTKAELQKFKEQMPEVNFRISWWLADVDPTDEDSIAYAEGNYTDDDMYYQRDEPNTHIRVALDIDGVSDANIKAGDEFIYRGFVFTVLDESLAISNNFIGCAKYYDDEIADFMYSDDEVNCTLYAILENLFD